MAKRYWTNEECEYLEERWGAISLDSIAKNLLRTKVAIKLKAAKLGLGDSRLNSDKISINQFSKVTGINNYTIKERWVRNGFKLYTIKQGKFKTNRIDMCFFWNWAEKHKNLVNFAKWQEGILGKEPDWVKEKRKADFSDPSKTNWNRCWTKREDSMLVEKTKSNRYTYKDLATELNRTENAIKRRLHDLKVPYRPVPRNNHIKWTDEENKLMKDLNNKGYSTAAIAKVLDKTQLSICDRLKII